MRGSLSGAAGGMAGTAVMTGVMFVAQKAGWLGQMPPQKIVDEALEAAGSPPEATDDEVRHALAGAAHFAFGAGMGALFGLLRAATGNRGSAPLEGVLFGTIVWAVSYVGWVPALGILPPPTRDRPGRPPSMIAAHWVYGGVLGAVAAGLWRRLSR